MEALSAALLLLCNRLMASSPVPLRAPCSDYTASSKAFAVVDSAGVYVSFFRVSVSLCLVLLCL